MATLTTVKSVAVTNNEAEPSVKNSSALLGGVVRHYYDSYTVASADEFGTSGLIRMAPIPAGARVIYARCIIPASGATGKFDVGWAASSGGGEAADPNGFFSALDPGTAAVDAEMGDDLPGWNKTFSEEVEVQFDCSEATADSGGDTYELEMYYVVN